MEILWLRYFAMPEKNNLKTECSTVNFTTAISTGKQKTKTECTMNIYHLDGTENVPEDYKEISFVCLRPDGSLELPSTLGIVCRKIAQKLDGFEGFPFSPVATHLHKQPSGKWSSTKRCAGTVRALRCQYHHECLCTLYKKSQAGIRKIT